MKSVNLTWISENTWGNNTGLNLKPLVCTNCTKISTILAIYLQHFKICHNCFQVFFTKRFGSKGPDAQGPIQEAAPSIRPVTTADCGNFGFDS